MTKFERAELNRMYAQKEKDKQIYWSYHNFTNRIEAETVWIIHHGLFFHLTCPYCEYKYDPEDVCDKIYLECPNCHRDMKKRKG